MKKTILIMLMFLIILIPCVLSFKTASDNYILHLSVQAGNYQRNISNNYVLLSTISQNIVGKNLSINYNMCLGYYCFIDYSDIIYGEIVRGGGYGASSGLVCNSTQVKVITPSGPVCISYVVYKQYRNKGFIILLCLILGFLFFLYLRRKKKEDENNEHKRKFQET